MLQDGLLLADGSSAVNFQIDYGTSLPVSGNNTGELFYLTSGPSAGLYVYDGATWTTPSVFNPVSNQIITGSWQFSNPIQIAAPSLDSHAATKSYVDSVAAGLDPKASARVGTVSNITLSGLQTVDGVVLVAGDRVLVKNQTTGSQNGLYVAATGAWVRTTDFDGTPASEVSSGAFIFITEGTVQDNTGWVLTTNDPITIGTSSLVWVQFSASGTTSLATAATNIANGVAGNIAYQSAPSTTNFVNNGTAGQVLTSAGNAAPTWAIPTATNLNGGGTGQIAFQSATNTTAFAAALTFVSGKLTVNNIIAAPDGFSPVDLVIRGGNNTSGGTTGSNGNLFLQGGTGFPGSSGGGYIYLQTAPSNASSVTRLQASPSGNVVMGAGLVALATTATTGFFHITASAGTPTGVPASEGTTTVGITNVPLHADTTNNSLYFYSSGTWRAAGSGGIAAAGTLSGATLAGNVVNSSLTSVGTLSALAVSGTTTQTGVLNYAGTSSPIQLQGLAGITGQVLTSAGAGATPTWGTATAAPGGATTQLQYNNAGVLAGTSFLTINGTTGEFRLVGGTIGAPGSTTLTMPSSNTASAGGSFTVNAGVGGASGGAGGNIALLAGNASSGNASGGAVQISAGQGFGSTIGAVVSINSGNGGATAAGGGLTLIAGNAGTTSIAAGGSIFIAAGNAGNASTSATGGDIRIDAGISTSGSSQGGAIFFRTGALSSLIERFRITSTGALAIAGAANFGTAGQVLTSAGNVAPTWTTPVAAAVAASTLTGTTLASNVVTSSLTSVGTLTGLGVTGTATVSGVGSIELHSSQVGSLGAPANDYFQVRALGGNTIGIAGFSWGRNASIEGWIGILGANGNFYSGTVAGDVLLNVGTGALRISTGITGDRVVFQANGAWTIAGSAGTAGQVLTSAGTTGAPTWSAPAAGTLTGTTLAANVVTSSLTSVGTLASLTVTGTVSAADPTITNHLTTKSYVDNLVQGLTWKTSVRAATTANITLSAPQTLDGIAVVAGDRVLVKNQTTASQNGVYVVAAGAWARSTDFDGAPSIGEVNGAAVFVREGTVHAETAWTQTTEVVTMGTTPLTFVIFSATGGAVAKAGDTMSGVLTNSSGFVGPLTGNATTATTLQIARTINGVSFNGAANITVAADASTLTGTTLATNVVASSLTSVGTLGSLNVTGAITAGSLINGAASTGTTTTAITTTAVTTIDSVLAASFRTAKYLVQVVDTQFHAVEILVIHDGTTVYKTEYAEVTSAAALGTFDAVITTGNLLLTFTAAAATTKTVKVLRTAITV